MEKRGIGHIEVILSFILFIGAVGFAVYYFVPEGTRYGDVSEDKVMESIVQNISVEVISYSMYVNGSEVIGSNLLGVVISEPGNLNPVASSVQGINNFDVVKTADGFCLRRLLTNWPTRDFVYLKLSEDFTVFTSPDCSLASYNPGYYTLASRDSEKIASEKRIKKLNESYNIDYESLKKYFGIKSSNDFGFSFVFANGQKIEAQKDIPSGLEIYSANQKIKVIRNNTIEYGYLAVKVW